ncbi:MAG: hypothetical protein A2216_00850 [Omnitrophica WOR_2 bacterium RIFOXYA2_FULL_45_12]|nr:MAG: hypothetical protein A2216_00850 [Omnitrophica WOR_2 bacterium RIFOXYA2_FULL_45_12]OGX61389.1 MAG: hypothetical protein A2471_02180 [Omnitrophica WOR_2 bacterium RIFOXYC2_FULL_45_15]
MGQISPSHPSKLIIGLIYRDILIKDESVSFLKKRFGKIDFQGPELDFNYTDYYFPELGAPLKRAFISFDQLRPEDELAEIKLHTNKLEERLSVKGKRRINIDPGFLSGGKLILATTKDQCHRVYLGKGIFAEVTLFYKQKTFNPWPWTYPDYQSREYLETFNSIRAIYQKQIKDAPRLSKGPSRRFTAGKGRKPL